MKEGEEIVVKYIAAVGGILLTSELCRRTLHDPKSEANDPIVKGMLVVGAIPAEAVWLGYKLIAKPFVDRVENMRASEE